jgi:hypothetical protein
MDGIRLEEVMTLVRIKEMQRTNYRVEGTEKHTRIPAGKPVLIRILTRYYRKLSTNTMAFTK